MVTTKIPLPWTAIQSDPGGKPHGHQTDAAKPNMKDWVVRDMENKASQPQPVSDGGKGVSNP